MAEKNSEWLSFFEVDDAAQFLFDTYGEFLDNHGFVYVENKSSVETVYNSWWTYENDEIRIVFGLEKGAFGVAIGPKMGATQVGVGAVLKYIKKKFKPEYPGGQKAHAEIIKDLEDNYPALKRFLNSSNWYFELRDWLRKSRKQMNAP